MHLQVHSKSMLMNSKCSSLSDLKPECALFMRRLAHLASPPKIQIHSLPEIMVDVDGSLPLFFG